MFFKGVYVYAGCYSDSSVKSLQEACSSKLKAVQVDVTKPEQLLRAVKFVEDDLSGKGELYVSTVTC